MGKDYFSDIDTNVSDSRTERSSDEKGALDDRISSEKSIRNIAVTPRRTAMTQRMSTSDTRSRQETFPARNPSRSRWFVWATIGAVSISALITGTMLILVQKTTVVITPRSHQVTFDPSTKFTAYPSGGASTGMTYSVEKIEREESKVVPANGVEKAEERASGTITVYNAYSDKVVRLIKNTRFESPTGLVFRIPASVEVPGKKGATPGEVTVTVFADQPGPSYNIGPTDKFTVPGLKQTPEMYNGVYARSTESFTGGFSGERPAISSSSLESARSELRALLKSKLGESLETINGITFADLANIEYESLPVVPESSGAARVTERMRITVPTFEVRQFAQSIAQVVSADAADNSVTMHVQDKLIAQGTDATSSLGTAPITFTLSGSAMLVWDIDSEAVKKALEKKELDAFKPIIANFLGIKDAEANPPLWVSSFPAAEKIDVKIINPGNSR